MEDKGFDWPFLLAWSAIGIGLAIMIGMGPVCCQIAWEEFKEWREKRRK